MAKDGCTAGSRTCILLMWRSIEVITASFLCSGINSSHCLCIGLLLALFCAAHVTVSMAGSAGEEKVNERERERERQSGESVQR